MSLWTAIADQVAATTQAPFAVERHSSAGGGCINATYVVEGCGQRYFVKVNDAALADMFEAEAAGLQAILASQTIQVPAPVCRGKADKQAFLVLEHLDLGGDTTTTAETLGRQLAQMHRVTQGQFGWYRDNAIGSTPQHNIPTNNWLDFWREHRLGFQLDLAAKNAAPARLCQHGEQLLTCFDALFDSHAPQPSLLHGDLWSGNYAVTRNGVPVIFDPAVYFGDREADLAMTELFGGFSVRFYDAYHEAWPLDPGYRTRKNLYNLYHVLNHFNLFGGGYAGQAQGMIERLLAEVR
jgi:protein-ribulosamine 3-kinase